MICDQTNGQTRELSELSQRSCWLVVSTPPAAAITLTGARKLSDGSFQFSFSNNPGAAFTVLAATNLPLALTNWTSLGGVTEVSPGQFQFTDPPAANSPLRLYRVRSP